MSKGYWIMNFVPKYFAAQCKRMIGIHPYRGAYLDLLTVVQHTRKVVPSRIHKAYFNTGRNISTNFMSPCECCYKIQSYKHKTLLYIYIYIYIYLLKLFTAKIIKMWLHLLTTCPWSAVCNIPVTASVYNRNLKVFFKRGRTFLSSVSSYPRKDASLNLSSIIFYKPSHDACFDFKISLIRHVVIAYLLTYSMEQSSS